MARRFTTALATTLALAGCNQSDFGAGPKLDIPDPAEGPGDPAWGKDDLSCNSSDECAPNETCEQNLCMPQRCTEGPYDSAAPIGNHYYFFSDKEIIAADFAAYDNQYWIDGYLPGGNSVEYPSGGGSWTFGAAEILDVAGGDIYGERPDAVVAIHEGVNGFDVQGSHGKQHFSLAFEPVAVAAGDVDQDSIDEVIVLGVNGEFAICNVDEAGVPCLISGFDGSVQGVDVAVGDIDGDHFQEPVFLIEVDGAAKQIIAYNMGSEETGESGTVGGNVDSGYVAIEVGDVAGNDGPETVLALRDDGFLGLNKDSVDSLAFDANDGIAVQGAFDVDADSKDLATGDFDMDGKDEIVLLYNSRDIDVFHWNSASELDLQFTSTLSVSGDPGRIALADFDGDSPSATQIEGPDLVAGPIVPTMVLQFPPYSENHSDGVSYLFVGSATSVSEEYSDSVSVNVGFEVGVGGGIEGVFSASVSAGINRELGFRRITGTRHTIGSRFSISPDTETHGRDFSVVMLTSSCYHGYKYSIHDPAGKLDDSLEGGEFAVLVPVGGRTTVWSSKRYNALAAELGNLPNIETNVRLGDPSSYPESPVRLDGTVLSNGDKVFRDPPSLMVSDVGSVGFWLSVSESEINETSMRTDISVSGKVSYAGMKFGASAGTSAGTGYSITVGKEALFGGGTPAISDDPKTPEDEYSINAFSYSPYVYRQQYSSAEGEDARFYVLGFSVSQN